MKSKRNEKKKNPMLEVHETLVYKLHFSTSCYTCPDYLIKI